MRRQPCVLGSLVRFRGSSLGSSFLARTRGRSSSATPPRARGYQQWCLANAIVCRCRRQGTSLVDYYAQELISVGFWHATLRHRTRPRASRSRHIGLLRSPPAMDLRCAESPQDLLPSRSEMWVAPGNVENCFYQCCLPCSSS